LANQAPTPRELGASPYCSRCPGAAPVPRGGPWELGIGMHPAMTSGFEDQGPQEPCCGICGKTVGLQRTSNQCETDA
jgi:hypothetical protein